MESHHNQLNHIAWILSSFDHHMIATYFFDEIFYRFTTSSNIIYTYGRVGLHKVVAVSTDRNSTSQKPAGDIVDSLLQEVPSIRAAFLISADSIVPRHGNVRVGDVVVGLGSGMKAGVVCFDHWETSKQKRLFTTSESRYLPETVLAAVNDMRSQNCRDDWLRRLEQDCPTKIPRFTTCTDANGELDGIQLTAPGEIDKTNGVIPKPALEYLFQGGSPLQRQPKAFGGLIASSERILEDPALIDSLATSNGIICFETAAANMKSRPFMVLSGISRYSDDIQQKLPSNEVCKVVVSYLASMVHTIDPTKLATESPIADYFHYETFDLDRPGFRLLRLEPGTGQIKCQVFQAYLDDEENLIPYEALSYCWGSNRLTSKITANGKDLFITENLSEALCHLRTNDQARLLWIDAICIDQSNLRERGHQVGCMSRIYSRADRVLIWLGYVKIEFKHIMSALKRFEARVPPGAWGKWSYHHPGWYEVWQNAQTYLPKHESDEIGQRSRLKFLMSQPWFSRVWILQEAAKAKKARVLCSEGWISAGTFALAPRLLGVTPGTQCQAIIDIMPGPSRRSSWWTQKQNLCTLLWRFRGSQAHDPRDRLYALLDLASDTKVKERITADYTKNEEAVVKDILAYLFNEDPSLLGFLVREIADLQRKIPNLSCMALEQMILRGAQIKDIQMFLQLQTEKVWLSEAAASYAWCVDTVLMDYLLNEPAFEHIAMGSVYETAILKNTVTVESFLNRREKKLKITRDTIHTTSLHSIDLLALVLEDGRDDIEMTEALVEEAVWRGSDTLRLLLDSRGNEVEMTEAVVSAAAKRGLNTLTLLLDRRGNEVKVTEALVSEAIRSGSDTLKLLLDRRGNEVKVTEALVSEAIRSGSNTLKLLLDRRGNEVKITDALVSKAARSGSGTLKLLLDRRGDEVEVTEALVSEAVRSGTDTLKLLLDRRGNEVEVTEAIVSAVARGGLDILKILLDRRGNEVKMTEAIISAAARGGYDTLKLLLDRRGDEVKVTEAVVSAAARSGYDTLKLLLDRRGKDIKVSGEVIVTARSYNINLLALVLEERRDNIEMTEALVEEAARSGSDTLKRLLDRCGNEVKVTEALVSEATWSGSDTLKLLLDRRGKDIKVSGNNILIAKLRHINLLTLVVEERRDDIEITEALVEEAARRGSDTLKLLLDRRGNEVKITDALVLEAVRSGSDTLKLLLDRRGNEVKVTEALVYGAARSGSDTLKLLLDRRGNEVKVTEAVVSAAARGGYDTLKLLLDRRGDEVKVTEAVVSAAARSGSDTLKLLLDRRGNEVKMTEAIALEAARRGPDTLKLLLDRRGKDIKVSGEIIRTARLHSIDLLTLVVEERRDDIDITEALVEEAARRGSDTLRRLLDRRGNEVKVTEAFVSEAAGSGSDTVAPIP
ncbi:hypothetical protein FAUST_9887 [Fusarium austroamericanum]|uniref:Heterokaryon incompatibility domain-containing protein n=1 Tax=Fusarium austroamericanum TaxID=282268 RepID=A0AAN5Z1V1_FUSAU|nr:hypothetical protein FAUST_9887 [Fusarium austroamericanum]